MLGTGPGRLGTLLSPGDWPEGRHRCPSGPAPSGVWCHRPSGPGPAVGSTDLAVTQGQRGQDGAQGAPGGATPPPVTQPCCCPAPRGRPGLPGSPCGVACPGPTPGSADEAEARGGLRPQGDVTSLCPRRLCTAWGQVLCGDQAGVRADTPGQTAVLEGARLRPSPGVLGGRQGAPAATWAAKTTREGRSWNSMAAVPRPVLALPSHPGPLSPGPSPEPLLPHEWTQRHPAARRGLGSALGGPGRAAGRGQLGKLAWRPEGVGAAGQWRERGPRAGGAGVPEAMTRFLGGPPACASRACHAVSVKDTD